MTLFLRVIELTCLTLFFELDTLNIPKVCSPRVSMCLRQEETMLGMLGSFSAVFNVMSAVDPTDIASSRPGTLLPRLSVDPAL